MQGQVQRRRVFYIPGFDPYPPRRYREFYRKEGAEQARISGFDLTMQADGSDAWRVKARIDGQDIDARVEVLVWSDIVGHSMDQGLLSTYLKMCRTAWIYISSGTLFRLMRLRRGPVIAALYPVVFLIMQLLVACAVALGLWLGVVHLLPYGVYLGVPIGAVAAWALLDWFRKHDNRVLAHYLMLDYAFSAGHWGAYPAAQEQRLSQFVDRIAEALADESLDEVLIVGHSSGAYMGASVLADLMRRGDLARAKPAVGFLSLGQVVPMVSFLPKADRLRRDLHDLSTCEDLTWVDISAMGDGCAFALCDPVGVTGVAPEGQNWPLMFSAAFSRTLGPERWKRDRRRWFHLHFTYLFALPFPEDYDYFRVTAGPMTLAERYKDRPPSPSCKRAPVSKFRGLL